VVVRISLDFTDTVTICSGRKRVAEEEDHEDAAALKRSKKGNFILDFDIIKSRAQEKLRELQNPVQSERLSWKKHMSDEEKIIFLSMDSPLQKISKPKGNSGWLF
jgi:hypothetical protein